MTNRRLPALQNLPLNVVAMRLAVPLLLVVALSGCVVAAVGAAATGVAVVAQERSVGEAVDDLTIRTTLNKLFLDESLGLYNDISFSVVEGRVLLKG